MALALAGAIGAWPPSLGAANQAPGAAAAGPRVIDDFESPSAWSAFPAEGVSLDLHSDAGERGRALRMEVRFTRGTGYAVARRAVSLDLPDDYVFRFRLRGDIPNNALEFKLVDSTGNNVWWDVRRNLEFPHEWRTISTRKRQIRFAWGPAGGGEIRHVAFVEIAITAGEGGAGSVWLDDLTLEPLAADSTLPPVKARASSGIASRAVDGDLRTSWRIGASDLNPMLELDFGRPREFGGLDLRWAPGRHLADYEIALSLDHLTWTAVDTVRGSDGGRDPLYLPESEARYVRLRSMRAIRVPIELNEAIIQQLEWSATPEAYFTNLAKDAPRGTYPRPYVGEQCAWAVVGPDAGHEEALLSEDGMLETGKGQYSIEPFLRVGGRLLTWADVTIRQTLSPAEASVPSVHWVHRDVGLTITASATADTTFPEVRVQYVVRNPLGRAQKATLYLAARPFQVNPPWQNIGVPGGIAPIRRIEHAPVTWIEPGSPRMRIDAWKVNDRLGVVAWNASAFGATTLDQGDIVEFLRQGRIPARKVVEDHQGFASGAFAFNLDLPGKGARSISLLVPLRAMPATAPPISALRPRLVPAVAIALPGAPDIAATLLAQIGWILINRDGGAIQPGSRNYDRSWIRDGSLTSSALLRMGYPEVVRDFIEWFAPFQYQNGKIPCCASERGPDPVTENDSHGQFIWLIAEYYRYTGDRALVERMWPHVAAAAAHMDSLRGERRTAEWRAPEKRKYFGLLLPSISHEGYPNPMHSYWDDSFAYRGYVDAAYLAEVLGRSAELARYAAARDTFARDLAASVAATMAEKGIDYVPGCAELGDFDATSTTVALTPTGAADLLPEAAIRATFERYWKVFTDRRDGRIQWEAFTPYEMRVIGSFVRLGWRDRANEALKWFMDYRNPPGWRQWAEVAYREKRAPKYIGDMPHTWVGSDFVRSVLDMLAYERGRDSMLVLGAGVPWAAIQAGHDAVGVNRLRTSYGLLSYTMRARADSVGVTIDVGTRIPPGGIVVNPPSRRPFRSATINGHPAPLTPEGCVIVRSLPARVVMSP
jgi:F5/8 type C domain-containing protein